ncbi:ethylbenzene dehydrogenase-related protein [Bradyrhizobium sp.]|uniref:ethylbenzene dehydrogenase-related protein n=1 Tax=Bradyrhizobium sp. TaxID=376 RepID=UPI002394F03F|nr:ethylbenzene dehydrogenase-related protein [Bradyrhizobium sp.]MDE2377961.1 hypothetical protein [Bradyrhizobium sp.]
MRRRKTDYATVILHWIAVAAIGVELFTGLRIATEARDRLWLNLLDAVLPSSHVWVQHLQAAAVLIAVGSAYAIYLVKSGLTRRVALDESRLRGLFGRKQARLGAIGAILTWGLFATILALIASGGLLYLGILAGHDTATVHWYATWLVLAFAGLHVLAHYQIGGTSQLFRIVRPQSLPGPAPRLDAVELLTLLVEQSEQMAQAAHPDRKRDNRMPLQPAQPSSAARRRPRDVTLQSNPFVVALAVAIAFTSVVVAADWLTVDTLRIHHIASERAPALDGDTSDPIWRNVKPFALVTNQGDNFDGKGESRVEIRAVHDGTWAYFLFVWQDPTRSLKQLPLIKRDDGWHLLHDGYEAGDEHAFNEDKFSVLLTTLDVTLAGDRTFHAGSHPVADAPPAMNGRGLHFTMAEGIYADVWQWKATSTDPAGWMDDAHFGPPLAPTPMQVANRVPYRGGFAPDPGTANYSDNFVADATSAGGLVRPRRLPKDPAAMRAAMGSVAPDPDLGESDGARWFMTDAESTPYSVEADRDIPVGSVVPGVIIAGEVSGDRADIRCAARWAAGHWALEVARRLDTGSQYDIPIRTGIFMRVAAFDHSQIGHTRHVRPIRLEVE